MGGNWCKIKEQQYRCPICGGKLFPTQNTMIHVMDGNTVIHCENDEHTFFSSTWDTEHILYMSDNASETSFKYDKKFKYENDIWCEVLN